MNKWIKTISADASHLRGLTELVVFSVDKKLDIYLEDKLTSA